MRSIKQVVQESAPPLESRAPTLEEIALEFPAWVRIVHGRKDTEFSPVAEVRVPYSPDILRLMRACKGARFSRDSKAWIVPAFGARGLSAALYALSTRSR
jgi:hypothetical protein